MLHDHIANILCQAKKSEKFRVAQEFTLKIEFSKPQLFLPFSCVLTLPCSPSLLLFFALVSSCLDYSLRKLQSR